MPLEPHARALILAAEVAAFLHDLGKLHPGFAGEMLKGGHNLANTARKETGINAAHGAILEPGRPYPDAAELAQDPDLPSVLQRLRADPAWAKALEIPGDWCVPGTVQADGLGAPLRQHHATKEFPTDQLSLLGDLYTFGADIRDSALDKGSGGAAEGTQKPDHACIADSFGFRQTDYSATSLGERWRAMPAILQRCLFSENATQDLAATRNRLYDEMRPLFAAALGETRRPTNDVTLWHHAWSSASFLKAAMAEGALRGDFRRWQNDQREFDWKRLGRVRFRLLGVRWDWNALSRVALSPAALVSLSERRRDVVAGLRALFELETAVGNVIYEDDHGVLVLLPGFHDEDATRSEDLFRAHIVDALAPDIAERVCALGTGTPFRMHWSRPTLYLTDYAEALGHGADHQRVRHLQAGEAALRELWRRANASDQLIQICPQCGLRPAETREYAPTESARREQPLCTECQALGDRDAKRARRRNMERVFGFEPFSYNLEDLAKAGRSSRIALVSVRVDGDALASGTALVTQLARPVGLIEAAKAAGIVNANALGDWFAQLLTDLEAGQWPDDKRRKSARTLLGDDFWLKEDDGRADGTPVERALAVARGFFLRESAGLPAEWALTRHDGDRLALFALRKHASPARLQRLWDDMNALWRDTLGELSHSLGRRLLPLSIDARGFRFAVAASDADATVKTLRALLSQQFAKLRGGLAAHVSCVVMRARFPLYLALECLDRLDARVALMPRQTWTLLSRRDLGDDRLALEWSTAQGNVAWQVDIATDDPEQPDRWHPHVLLARRGDHTITGPDRLTHVADLLPGDQALVPPMTFDTLVLEGSGRRHDLTWHRRDEQLLRPHWVLGAVGHAPLLLERFDEFSDLVRLTGWDEAKLKGLQGEMVETYEKWVRDAPASLAESGRKAWCRHIGNMLARYVGKGPEADPDRARLLDNIADGRFFDAVEWTTLVAKQHTNPTQEAPR